MIWIAGQEASDELRAEFHRKQEAMRASGLFYFGPREASALRMASAGDDSEWLALWMQILPQRAGIALDGFTIAAQPGFRGRVLQRVRSLLWRVFRYQHERVAYRQNLVNAHMVTAIRFHYLQMVNECAELRGRIEQLEAEQRQTCAS